jgi:hypothetical protein
VIDYWKLVKDFSPGDIVQHLLRGEGLSPYVGRVTAVMPGIGFVDVQFPFGNERVSPEELVRVNPEFTKLLPPSLNFSYQPGLDAKVASSPHWGDLPADFHVDLAKLYRRGAHEVAAYDSMWRRYSSVVPDEAIRAATIKFYRFAFNSMTLLLEEHARKTATYWASQNRQHRATRAEVDACRPNCPKCGTPMRKATYKMAEGKRMRLFACPKDLYLIKQTDIMGPDGQVVEW